MTHYKSPQEIERDACWDYLVETGIATEEELRLVANINGYSLESLESVIYARCGLRSFDQLKDEDED